VVVEEAVIPVVVAVSSPSSEEVKTGLAPYRSCDPVLFKTAMYGIDNDHPYPTSLFWAVS
jgi:hypothetical protein